MQHICLAVFQKKTNLLVREFKEVRIWKIKSPEAKVWRYEWIFFTEKAWNNTVIRNQYQWAFTEIIIYTICLWLGSFFGEILERNIKSR